ncbi:MAG: shikimate dehydrogenase [Verrucomicrobiota bacterium]|nr:shikimate dehydrogenase [Verrucomicrobiota bacterium]
MAHDTLTIDDLGTWSFPGTALAVLGHPIQHSLSPAMHNAALAAMSTGDAQFRSWKYFRFDIPPERLPEALPLFHAKGFLGLNLTIPHKVQAVDLIAEVVPQARALGAVNTLLATPRGWQGHNTDGYGIEQALQQELGASLKDASVVMLGAGGAARAIAAQCLGSGCRELWIGNRDQVRLAELLALVQPLVQADSSLKGFNLAEPPSELPQKAIVINATSLGLKPEDPAPINLSQFTAGTVVFDTTYGSHKSRLCTDTRSRGWPESNGLPMLVWQGARALEIWSRASVPAAVMRTAATAGL